MKTYNTASLLYDQLKVRVFEESIPRIFSCLDRLEEAQIWHPPSENLSSIGNLILHLEGNARQWILSGLYQQPDNRKRSLEFDPGHNQSAEELKQLLKHMQHEILKAIETPVDLNQTYHPQVFTESGVGIVVHVIEHFSYHTGQIAFYTKMLTGQDLKFYGDQNLEV